MTPTDVADALGKNSNTIKQRLWHMSRDGQVSAADGRYSTVTRNPRNRDNPDAVTVTPVTGVTGGADEAERIERLVSEGMSEKWARAEVLGEES